MGKNSNDRRIIINWDECNMWSNLLRDRLGDDAGGQRTARLLEEIVDEHHKAQVDTIVHCVFGFSFRSHLRSSKATDLLVNPPNPRPTTLEEAGIDFLQLLIDRCHQRNMEFVAGLRMNDRHVSTMTNKSQSIKDHPEWHLKSRPGGLDFAHEGVRRGLFLAFIKEVLETYDVDGIEFDWMRWCHMFEAGEGSRHADLLTEFTREARDLLDTAVAGRNGNRMLLGVRVPQTVEECQHLGFDVATWIQEGLIDWVVPSDFLYMDFTVKTEAFVEMARGTDCKIYPAIHPSVCWGVDAKRVRMMTPANYRAAAQNFYSYGANGISPYNYQWHWGEPRGTGRLSPGYMWPAALGYLRELRDPESVRLRDRHYLYYPLWSRTTCSKSPSDFWHDDNIYLQRSGTNRQGSRSFRLAEDLSDPHLRSTLQFKAVGLYRGEFLEIQLNGNRVSDEYVSRLANRDGQQKSEGRTLTAFCLYVIDLNWWGTQKPPIINGDNELSVHLVPEEGETEGTIVIDELEVYVYVE